MAKSQKIRIRLKAYDHKALDQSASKIVKKKIKPAFISFFRSCLCQSANG